MKVFFKHQSIVKIGLGAAIALFVMAAVGFASVTDTASYAPVNYNTFVPPPVGGSYVDPAFGSTVKRVSDARSINDAAQGGKLTMITNEYSTEAPFNSDNSRLILQHDSYFALYDGGGTYLRDLPFAINAGSEPRWSRTDPNVLYFVNSNQLKKYNVGTQVMTVLHTFSEYSAISGMGESDISYDGDHFVLAGDTRYIFVYEISTDTKGSVLDSGGRGFDSLYNTPDGHVTVSWYQNGTARFNGIEMFDRNMNFLRQEAHVEGHMHMARDLNGDEVLVWANSADPNPICNNGIVKIRLADASQTCLVSLDWSLAVHISASDSGWAFVETYAPSNPDPTNWPKYTNEILQIKLDGSEVIRLVQHRSRPLDSYYYMPRTSASRDGSRIVYSSNFDLQVIVGGYPAQYTDTYMIVLDPATSNNTQSPVQTPVATPTPAPVTTPAPVAVTTPAPTVNVPDPSATATRFEQTSTAVVLTGSWTTNNLAANSGGSAVLSMNAGDSATFSFNGTGANWIAYRDEWSGIAKVYVDGTLAGSVDTYSTPSAAQATAYSVAGLAAGSHTLTVQVTGTKSAASGGSWVWVDAFAAIAASAAVPVATPAPAPTPAPVTSAPPATTVTVPDPPATITRFEQTSTAVVLTGSWTTNKLAAHSGGSAVLSMNAGDSATFSFNGTGANWIAYRDEWSGIAKVYVDGTLAGSVDTYSTPSAAQATAYSVAGLAAGSHTLTVQVTGTKSAASGGSWVWVDAFEATSATAAVPAVSPAPAPAPTPAPVAIPVSTPVSAASPQPTSLTFSSSTIAQGDCYTVLAGNGANMTIDIQLDFPGGSAVVSPWTTLNGNGASGLLCTSPEQPVGAYVIHSIRNTNNGSWVPVGDATIHVTPRKPVSLSFNPGVVSQGGCYTVMAGNGANMTIDIGLIYPGGAGIITSWVTLDGNGRSPLLCTSPAQPKGNYNVYGVRNSLDTNGAFIAVNSTITVN